MFDVGFWEFLVIGVVALLVVGPERLPGLARTAGIWVGKVRRFVSSVKADIDREVRTEELQRILNKQNEFRNDIYDIVEETKKSVEETASELSRAENIDKPTTPPTETPKAKLPEPADSDGEKRSAR